MNFGEENIKELFKAYENGKSFKENLGSHGIYTQGRINERFYRGDQWKGVEVNSLPLVRYNVIKRIGEYKMSNITSNPITVNFSAEGIPNTLEAQKSAQKLIENGGSLPNEDVSAEMPTKESYIPTEEGQLPFDTAAEGTADENDAEEISFVMTALSDYFKICAERLKFDTLKAAAFKNAYITGTAIFYTFWNDKIKTGLYSDERGTDPILGDIDCELIDIENFYVSDPNQKDINRMEYVIVAQRQTVEQLKREAKANGISKEDIESIKSDDTDTAYLAGDRGEDELEGEGKVTVLTKFFKVYEKDGSEKIHAVKATEKCLIRDEYDTMLEKYPFAVFRFEDAANSFFGDSEVTYLVPNQIAINRMVSACVWNAIMLGMPITLINRDFVDTPLTNEPGQCVEVTGENIKNCISYVNPPSLGSEQVNVAQNLMDNTLSQSGANDAALGNLRPDNTSAIIAVREAAQQPLQTVQTRFYQFCEDIARCFAEYWIKYYGNRKIKMESDSGTWYLPINAERYGKLLITARVDVGPASMFSELQTVTTLDNLFGAGIITQLQYLERIPKGYIPERDKLIEEIKRQQETQAAMEQAAIENQAASAAPEGNAEIPTDSLSADGAADGEMPAEIY